MQSKKSKKKLRTLSQNCTLAKLPDRLARGDSWRAVDPALKGELYGARWRRERVDFLLAHPLCVRCLAQGIRTTSDTVDHRVPHRGNLAIFWDRTLWDALCTPCHNSGKQREEWNAKYGRR